MNRVRKAVIVSPFDNYGYEVRNKYIEEILIDSRFDVRILSSDFDHRNKKQYTVSRKNLELIHVPKYKKNLSISRVFSHVIFAKKVYKRIEELSPEIVYCSGPPNSVYKYVSKYKRKTPKVKVIFEIGDLWPETMPINDNIKKMMYPILRIWSGLRDNNTKYADGIVYECKMFENIVSKTHPDTACKVLYLSKDDYYKDDFSLKEQFDGLRIAYVGSINNIIDCELIVDILRLIGEKRKVCFVVIGGGEESKKLFERCDKFGIDYENHGIIYNPEEKHNILSTCQFGLNIMKSTVSVGATMKSLEYFHEGLVLINNIPADTADIINQYGCGFNIVNDYTEVVKKISDLSDKDINYIRKNSRRVYEEVFDTQIFKKEFLRFLNEIQSS